MTPLKGLNDILYLVQLGETGNYELVNPQEAPEGQVLFSLEKTTIEMVYRKGISILFLSLFMRQM